MDISSHIPDLPDRPRVVIIGGGFGGIELAKALKNKGVQVVMLDRHNYHTFQPLLYQVATAGLEPDSIAGPLRRIFEKQKDFFFRMAKVTEISPVAKEVTTPAGKIRYDYLVIATGSTTNYFGNKTVEEKSFPLKKIPQALDLRSHILQNFEKLTLTEDPAETEKLMNVVIVGGGPTGVELAGALGELKKHVLPHDYPELDFGKMKIFLVEGMGKLLGGMSERSSEKALEFLKKFDVDVLLNRIVKEYDGERVLLSDGTVLLSDTLIWAAGVKGEVVPGLNPDVYIGGSRIAIDEYNRVKGYEDVFAIGDIALCSTKEYPKGHPMLAPVAMQQGKLLAKNLVKIRQKKPLKPFKYNNQGVMATVGRNKAVVELPFISFRGIFAWFVWMFVHLMSIVGFRNKLVVLSNWIWNYFTYDRGTRLIIRPYQSRKALKKSDPLPVEKGGESVRV